MARLGISWRGMVSQDVVWSGGRGMVRTGGAGRGWDRYGQARYGSAVMARTGETRFGPAWRGKAWSGWVRSGKAVTEWRGWVRSVWVRRSGSGVARPGVMRSGVATKAKTKVGGRADPSPSNKRKEEKWKKE